MYWQEVQKPLQVPPELMHVLRQEMTELEELEEEQLVDEGDVNVVVALPTKTALAALAFTR